MTNHSFFRKAVRFLFIWILLIGISPLQSQSLERMTQQNIFYSLQTELSTDRLDKMNWQPIAKSSGRSLSGWLRIQLKQNGLVWIPYQNLKQSSAYLQTNGRIQKITARENGWPIENCQKTCWLYTSIPAMPTDSIYRSTMAEGIYYRAKNQFYRLGFLFLAGILLLPILLRRQWHYTIGLLFALSTFLLFAGWQYPFDFALFYISSSVWLILVYQQIPLNQTVWHRYLKWITIATAVLSVIMVVPMIANSKIAHQLWISSHLLTGFYLLAMAGLAAIKGYKPVILLSLAQVFFIVATLFFYDFLFIIFPQISADPQSAILSNLLICMLLYIIYVYLKEEALFRQREKGLQSVITTQEEIMGEQEDTLTNNRQRLQSLRLEYSGKEKNLKARLGSIHFIWMQLIDYCNYQIHPLRGRKPTKKTQQTLQTILDFAHVSRHLVHALYSEGDNDGLNRDLKTYIDTGIGLNLEGKLARSTRIEIRQTDYPLPIQQDALPVILVTLELFRLLGSELTFTTLQISSPITQMGRAENLLKLVLKGKKLDIESLTEHTGELIESLRYLTLPARIEITMLAKKDGFHIEVWKDFKRK